ncbi:MAG: hypothetical protein RR214_08385, partial [Synergistaceae bacterium]
DPAELLGLKESGCKFYSLKGEEAVLHIYRLAAGLCSQVPLEDQILGQMKDSLQRSRELKCCGPVAGQLFQSAIAAGKEIRTEAKRRPHTHAASVGRLALDKAKEYFGRLSEARVLVVGSGDMGILCANLFADEGAQVLMTRRRIRTDGRLPHESVEIIDYEDRYDALLSSDIIIGATASPHCVLHEKDFPRDGSQRLLLDLAVPRDIEPSIKNISEVTLLDMDSLGQDCEDTELTPVIESIIAKEKDRFMSWLGVRECMPMIEDICSYAERELTESLSSIVCENDREIQGAARNMINKLLFTMKEKVGLEMAKNCYSALAKAARG